MQDWNDALDAYTERLEHQRMALADGNLQEDVSGFDPPAGLGPLPRELAARARRLLRETTDLEAELSGRLIGTGQELVMLRTTLQDASVPRFVDRRA